MIDKKSASMLTSFVLALIFCIFGIQGVSAQVTGIRISPTILEELVDPGDVIQRQLKVANNSDVPRTFYVYLRDFGAEGETGQARLLPPGSVNEFSIAAWIDITSEGIDFAPGEEKVIKYRIIVPEETGPGGYRGAILFGTEPPRLQVNSEDKGAGMAVAQQAASLVLLQVKGDIDEEAEIREFNTDKDFYSTPYDVDFLIRIENLGNVHVKPLGAIKIKNMFGREVAVLRVNENGGNILPGSTRKFPNTRWQGNFAFGKYEATLGLSYGTDVSSGGQGKSSLVGTKTFWIFPWRIIVPVGLGLLLFAVITFLMLRLYRNRAIKKAMERAGMSHVKYVKKYQGPSPVMHMGMILLTSFVIMLVIVLIIYFLFLA